MRARPIPDGSTWIPRGPHAHVGPVSTVSSLARVGPRPPPGHTGRLTQAHRPPGSATRPVVTRLSSVGGLFPPAAFRFSLHPAHLPLALPPASCPQLEGTRAHRPPGRPGCGHHSRDPHAPARPPTWRWMKTTEPSSLQVPPWRSTCSILRIWRKRMPLRGRHLCAPAPDSLAQAPRNSPGPPLGPSKPGSGSARSLPCQPPCPPPLKHRVRAGWGGACQAPAGPVHLQIPLVPRPPSEHGPGITPVYRWAN